MKRIVLTGVLGILVLAIVLVWRAISLTSKQIPVERVEPARVDRVQLAETLSKTIQFRTVSHEDRGENDAREFLALHDYLAEAYPKVHATLTREIVGDYSLLYTWRGSEAGSEAAVLMAHQDVVPVEPGTEGDWTHPPFSGAIAEDFVWGRGALDDKASMVGILDAVETLAVEGYQPRRTLYLAFGHDEEVGGDQGARKIAEKLAAAGAKVDFVLDEGGAILDGSIMGLSRPVAIVSVAEKGFASLELTVDVQGGHSSVPPRNTAVGILSRAIVRLEEKQVPGGLRTPVREMFEHLGPEMPLARKVVAANLWLFEPFLERYLEGDPVTNALVRTTTAATIFHAGVKANVLPNKARAVVNFRILPGDTVESVTEHAREVIDDDRIHIRVMEEARDPSSVSLLGGPIWEMLQKSIRELHPDVVVAPTVLVGGSDSMHFDAVSDGVYRFEAVRMDLSDLQRAHGIDERISLENLEQLTRYYIHLIRKWNEGRF